MVPAAKKTDMVARDTALNIHREKDGGVCGGVCVPACMCVCTRARACYLLCWCNQVNSLQGGKRLSAFVYILHN